MKFLDLSGDSIGGTILEAQVTAGTIILEDVVGDQRLADTRGTPLVFNVRFILVAEISDRREHGVRSRFPKPAD